MKRNRKSPSAGRAGIENILLIALFVFASIGTYVVLADSGNRSEKKEISKPTLYVKSDFSKYNTVKPTLKEAKTVANK